MALEIQKYKEKGYFFAFFLQRMLFLWPISISQEFKWSFTNAHVLPLYWFLWLNGPCYYVTYTFRTFLHFNISKNQDFMIFWIFAKIENMWKTAIKKKTTQKILMLSKNPYMQFIFIYKRNFACKDLLIEAFFDPVTFFLSFLVFFSHFSSIFK